MGTAAPHGRWRGALAGALTALMALPGPGQAQSPGTAQLERSWRDLDQQLRALDALIPADPDMGADGRSGGLTPSQPLPEALLQPNRPATGPLQRPAATPAPPLSLPTAASLQAGSVQSLSLEQALAIAFANSAALQAQRELVAASLGELQAQLGSYWPRISAFANGSSGQSSLYANAPVGSGRLGLGPQFSATGLLGANGQPTAGAFYVPSGGSASLTTTTSGGTAGLQLDYALIDFARTPTVQAARARLQRERHSYANQLRLLQLQVSEAYYQLQQADQTVRIQDAAVRNDLLILRDALDLQQAGLVPRLDVLRRRAIEAANQETLIQALADRAVARRQLAVLLTLPPGLTPSAGDPITPMPRWPLNLEESLLAAYRGNPELEAILATREALARQRDATAAALLPRLSLFANGGVYGSTANTFNVSASNGGCCGTTVIPVQNSSGGDWSVGLSLQWLLFDAGTTAGQVRALARREAATSQQVAAQRDAIRLRLEQAFFSHEASLAKLSAARRGVTAALEAFRDVKLRYQTGLSSELDLSNTQERLIASLVQRLNATVGVNISYARLLRELLPMPLDPGAAVTPQLNLPPGAAPQAAAGPPGPGRPDPPGTPPAGAPAPAPGQSRR